LIATYQQLQLANETLPFPSFPLSGKPYGTGIQKKMTAKAESVLPLKQYLIV